MAALAALARNTCLEVIRQPAWGIVVITTLVLFALSPRFAMFSLREEAKLLKEFGTSTLLLSGWVLACLGAGQVVRREIETRTTLTLLSKPMSREMFLAGKFLGVALALALSTWTFTLALLLAAREGPATSRAHVTDWPVVIGGIGAFLVAIAGAGARYYRTGASFSATFSWLVALTLSAGFAVAACFDRGGSLQPFAAGFDPLLVRGAFLALFALLVLAAFAVPASLWIGRGGTFVLTALLFAGGLALSSFPSLERGAAVVVPDFRVFWIGDLFYRTGSRLTVDYLILAFLYCASYAGLFLALGALSFRRKGL